MKTAIAAAGLASAGFLVPFGFIYAPGLLLQGTPVEIATSVGSALLGVTCLAAGMTGFVRRSVSPIERVLLIAAAIALISPGVWTDLFGVGALVITGRPGPIQLGEGSAQA